MNVQFSTVGVGQIERPEASGKPAQAAPLGVPQKPDTVQFSKAALQAAGDVDHDGDSK